MQKVNDETIYSLQEIQKKLGTEQHKLIHLCEKGVIIPDIEDSSGRGSMRRFSERNLFEFALAFELRRFLLPLNYIAPIIRILEAFERYASKELEAFSLPRSLQNKTAVKLRLIIAEGSRLFFGLKGGRTEVYLGGIDLHAFSAKEKASLHLKKLHEDPRPSFISYIEVNLNKIAAPLL